MGYRSEVVLAVSGEIAPYFMAMLAKNPSAKKLCEDADTFQGNFDESGGWLAHWNCIKWYGSYPEIEILNRFIEAMESEDLSEYGEPAGSQTDWNDHYTFVKVGEDSYSQRIPRLGKAVVYP